MATIDRVVSKTIALTDTVLGDIVTSQIIDATLGTDLRFKFFKLKAISAGTIEIKFGANGDFIPMIVGDEYADLLFNEIYIKPSAGNTITVIATFVN